MWMLDQGITLFDTIYSPSSLTLHLFSRLSLHLALPMFVRLLCYPFNLSLFTKPHFGAFALYLPAFDHLVERDVTCKIGVGSVLVFTIGTLKFIVLEGRELEIIIKV